MISKNLVYSSIPGCDFLVDKMDTARKRDHDMFVLNKTQRVVYESVYPHPRCGVSGNPMKIMNPAGFEIPDYRVIKDDFVAVTDLRSAQVAEIVSQDDLPITVFWSGGIDSTLILAAMIKNWNTALRKRVVVKLNNASYLENPWFFDKVIQQHFQYTNDQVRYQQCYCLTGNIADSLWVQADFLELLSHLPGARTKNIKTHPDDLLDWVSFKSNRGHAEWLYQLVMTNSKESGIDLIDYEDFYWWLNFNFYYSGQHFKLLQQLQAAQLSTNDWEKYQQNNITWFHSDQYQLWSMNNRSNGVKFDGSVRSYKMPAKRYIFSVDKNPWYRDYKTKTGSPMLRPHHETTRGKKLVALYEDGEAVFSR